LRWIDRQMPLQEMVPQQQPDITALTNGSLQQIKCTATHQWTQLHLGALSKDMIAITKMCVPKSASF